MTRYCESGQVKCPRKPECAHDCHFDTAEIDLAMLEDKRKNGYARRNQATAMRLQLDYQLKTGEFL